MFFYNVIIKPLSCLSGWNLRVNFLNNFFARFQAIERLQLFFQETV